MQLSNSRTSAFDVMVLSEFTQSVHSHQEDWPGHHANLSVAFRKAGRIDTHRNEWWTKRH